MEDDIIRELKEFINKGDLSGITEKWDEFQNETDFGREIAWDYVFQKIYIHSCLKKQTKIVEWLLEIFNTFNEFHQIAIKPTFAYGKYLLNK